jgi:hypothetical protein
MLTASDFENIIVTPNKGVAACNTFYGIKEPKLKILRKFRELVVVENHD